MARPRNKHKSIPVNLNALANPRATTVCSTTHKQMYPLFEILFRSIADFFNTLLAAGILQVEILCSVIVEAVPKTRILRIEIFDSEL